MIAVDVTVMKISSGSIFPVRTQKTTAPRPKREMNIIE
jgi:hypothetical protein